MISPLWVIGYSKDVSRVSRSCNKLYKNHYDKDVAFMDIFIVPSVEESIRSQSHMYVWVHASREH